MDFEPVWLKYRRRLQLSSDAGLLEAARDAFGLIGTTFRELDWETLIFFERAVPIGPDAWYKRIPSGQPACQRLRPRVQQPRGLVETGLAGLEHDVLPIACSRAAC
jgi:hypothetical protein